MKFSFLLSAMLVASQAWSQVRVVVPEPRVRPTPPRYDDRREYSIESEIIDLARELVNLVREGLLSQDQLRTIRNTLRQTVDAARGIRSSELVCTKGSNGLFYPTSSRSGNVVGSTSWNAGYSDFESCRQSLPSPYEKLACMKQSNGLVYPSNPETGEVVGSTSWNAGHSSQTDCRQTLPRAGSRTACFKQSNGLFYLTDAQTGSVIGSTSWNAGYSDLTSCLRVLNQ